MSIEKKEYVLRGADSLVRVDKEVYTEFYRMRRRVKHLEEMDRKHGVVSYHALDTDECDGEEILSNPQAESVENVVIKKLMIEKLRKNLTQLEITEQALIEALFFENQTEQEFALSVGVHQSTICRNKTKILKKLKKLMENENFHA